jgi:hypothetical protein
VAAKWPFCSSNLKKMCDQHSVGKRVPPYLIPSLAPFPSLKVSIEFSFKTLITLLIGQPLEMYYHVLVTRHELWVGNLIY